MDKLRGSRNRGTDGRHYGPPDALATTNARASALAVDRERVVRAWRCGS